MVDATIYGWSYDLYHAAMGWDMGDQLVYEAWENFWARKVDSYIFQDTGNTPRLTDADEILEVGDIVNEMLVQMNIYLKAETGTPLDDGLFATPGFPYFKGNPNADNRRGTGHFRVLNKYRKIYSDLDITTEAIRLKKTLY